MVRLGHTPLPSISERFSSVSLSLSLWLSLCNHPLLSPGPHYICLSPTSVLIDHWPKLSRKTKQRFLQQVTLVNLSSYSEWLSVSGGGCDVDVYRNVLEQTCFHFIIVFGVEWLAGGCGEVTVIRF